MSEVDAQRAMREAKYARLKASGPTRREAAAAAGGATPGTAAVPSPPSPPAPPAGRTSRVTPAAPVSAAPAGELCGHRSMNGRTCTREAAHAEKNHRYG